MYSCLDTDVVVEDEEVVVVVEQDAVLVRPF
jgi:hypothetical protein